LGTFLFKVNLKLKIIEQCNLEKKLKIKIYIKFDISIYTYIILKKYILIYFIAPFAPIIIFQKYILKYIY